MTAVICSVCDGTPGRHDQARHQAFEDRNRAAWARRPTSIVERENKPERRRTMTDARETTTGRETLLLIARLEALLAARRIALSEASPPKHTTSPTNGGTPPWTNTAGKLNR